MSVFIFHSALCSSHITSPSTCWPDNNRAWELLETPDGPVVGWAKHHFYVRIHSLYYAYSWWAVDIYKAEFVLRRLNLRNNHKKFNPLKKTLQQPTSNSCVGEIKLTVLVLSCLDAVRSWKAINVEKVFEDQSTCNTNPPCPLSCFHRHRSVHIGHPRIVVARVQVIDLTFSPYSFRIHTSIIHPASSFTSTVRLLSLSTQKNRGLGKLVYRATEYRTNFPSSNCRADDATVLF